MGGMLDEMSKGGLTTLCVELMRLQFLGDCKKVFNWHILCLFQDVQQVQPLVQVSKLKKWASLRS